MTLPATHPDAPKGHGASRRTVYAALAGNLAVAITKIVAAVVTGSSAMLSEAIHSIVDTGNEVLLLYGYRQSEKRPNLIHPLGYGRELYFWSFIVALLLFSVGAGVSIYQGVRHVMEPDPVENIRVTYVVLGLSFVFEAYSWWVAWKGFSQVRAGQGFWEAFRKSKDPPAFMVLFEDTAALVGIVIAAMGIYLSERLDLPMLDGVASILIGLVLAIIAGLLAMESKSLLIGERAPPALVEAICRIAAQQPGVRSANSALTAQLSPNQSLVALSIEFAPTLTVAQVESCVSSIENRVKVMHPDVIALFVKPQTLHQFQSAVRHRFGDAEN